MTKKIKARNLRVGHTIWDEYVGVPRNELMGSRVVSIRERTGPFKPYLEVRQRMLTPTFGRYPERTDNYRPDEQVEVTEKYLR